MSRQRDLIASAIRGMQGLTETAGGSYRKATERAQAKTQSIREDRGVDTKGAAKGVASLVTSGDGKKEKKNKENNRNDALLSVSVAGAAGLFAQSSSFCCPPGGGTSPPGGLSSPPGGGL